MISKRQTLRGIAIASIFSGLAWVGACAIPLGGGTALLTNQCIVPTDQEGTLSGHWPVTPVPIAFHSGDWASDEEADMTAAADTWNSFYTASQSLTTIDYGSAGSPNSSSASKPASVCASSIVSGTSFSGQVVIYKQGAWPHPDQPNAIALTTFCATTAKPLSKFYMAIIEVNYQNFFVTGKELPDLQSIVLHEFGHLMGLNHSCAATSTPGFPLCSDPNLDPDYYYASMFPSFSFDTSGLGQQKRDLGLNDQERANCLYGAASGN